MVWMERKERCPFMGAVVCVILGHARTFRLVTAGRRLSVRGIKVFHGAGRCAPSSATSELSPGYGRSKGF